MFRPDGRHTASGIVFVPTVNHRKYGLFGVRNTVRKATGSEIVIYSGTPPRPIDRSDWEVEKRKNANCFKNNKVPILVATKAFGMGIDKPNVRWTIHFGMPGSLESFYQEAGRAGRDRKSVHCAIVFSEYDASRTDKLLDPGLSLAELQTRFSGVADNASTRDDVTTALWFHLEGFRGIFDEIEQVRKMLVELGDLTLRVTVNLAFGADKEEGRGRELAICRLLKIGVVSDYRTDYGARKFVVDACPFDFEKSKKLICEHVYASQPAKVMQIARRLDEISCEDRHQAACSLARVFIEFIYDVVERSRRRMIQESVLLARSARSDADIRARLLDYLQEGLGAEQIGRLLEETQVSLPEWCDLIEKCQTAMDAGELRGLCIRALESYPGHPGLMFARAASEAMCSDHDFAVSSQGFGDAILGGMIDYQLPQEGVEAAIEGMCDVAQQRAQGLGASLVIALLGLDETDARLAFAVKAGLERAKGFGQDSVQVAVALYRMRELTNALEVGVACWKEQYEAAGVQHVVEGG